MSEAKRPDVSVIVVTYNSAAIIERCLCAVREQAGVSYEVLVVDNDSRDETAGVVRGRFPEAIVIESGGNVGFAAANNRGIEHARGRYVFFLNPDAFLEPDAMATLVAALDARPEAAVCAPRLLNADGSLQYSARNFPTVPNQLFEALMLHKVMRHSSCRWGDVIYDPAFYTTDRSVDWLSGAALLVRAEALEEVGSFDERFFLYSEEKDLQYRLALLGWGRMLCAGATAVHAHGDSYRQDLFLTGIRSKAAYFEKHFRGFRRIGLRGSLMLYLTVRVLAIELARVFGQHRAAERLPGYLGGLRFLARGPWTARSIARSVS